VEKLAAASPRKGYVAGPFEPLADLPLLAAVSLEEVRPQGAVVVLMLERVYLVSVAARQSV